MGITNRVLALGALITGAIAMPAFAPAAFADPPPPPPPPGIPAASNQVPWVPGMGGLPGDGGPPMPPGIPASSAYPGGEPPPPTFADPPPPTFADPPPPVFPPAAPAPAAPPGYVTGGPVTIGGDSGPGYQIVGPGYVPGPNEVIIGGTAPAAPQPVGPYTPGGSVIVGGDKPPRGVAALCLVPPYGC